METLFYKVEYCEEKFPKNLELYCFHRNCTFLKFAKNVFKCYCLQVLNIGKMRSLCVYERECWCRLVLFCSVFLVRKLFEVLDRLSFPLFPSKNFILLFLFQIRKGLESNYISTVQFVNLLC